MKLKKTLESIALLMGLTLLIGCHGQMTVLAVDPGDDDDTIPTDDDDIIPSDDDDITPGDDDDITPSDDDDTQPGDDDTAPGDDDDTQPGDDDTAPGDDDDTAPGPEPIAECGAFEVPPGGFANGSAHYSGDADADRDSNDREWSGCEVKPYFDSNNHYQCQIYWSLSGPRVEFGPSECSVYVLEATYIPQYSDCSPTELGNESYLLNDFEWHYGTEYQFSLSTLSLYVGNQAKPEIPGGPPGGLCGFNGPQGSEWFLVQDEVGYQNSGGDGWDHIEFVYSTDFQARN
jgi:hypothetical protein